MRIKFYLYTMESKEMNKQCAQNQLYHLHLIPFIKSSLETEKTVPYQKESLSKSTLSGEEASDFYNCIISTPSTSKVQNVAACRKMLKPKVKSRSAPQDYSPLKSSIFHYAQEGNLKGVEDLVSHGCSFDQQDMYGWTPLMCAAYEGHTHIVEYLMNCGADLNIKNSMNMTAFDMALQRNHSDVINCIKKGVFKSNESHPIPENDCMLKYCDICKVSYKGTMISHERSISHLFCSEKTNLSTFYHIPENNKGFQIMLKNGWDKNKGLGLNADGRKFPIKTVLKKNRECIGRTKEVSKVTHFGPNDSSSVKNHKLSGVKLVRERTLKKWERNKLERKQRHKEISFRREFL